MNREHPPISHKLQSVSSDQRSGVSSVRLLARTKGRREQADSVINFLLICTFQKKQFNYTLNIGHLTYRNRCFVATPQCPELWAGVLNIQ